jgi:DNA polymerase (family X)
MTSFTNRPPDVYGAGIKMPLAQARAMAEKVAATLAPMCERIEIAGSIRRARPEVGDIDLVILPKPGELAAIQARCKQRCRVITEGSQNFICGLPLGVGKEFQLDIFFARPAHKDLFQTLPSNFGSLLLCRTGSKEHNIWIVNEARKVGCTWRPYQGLFNEDGYCVAAETEAEIFKALDMDPIAPERRER